MSAPTAQRGPDGRTVLIAGGGSAAGDAVATALLAAGARVLLASRHQHDVPDGATWLECDLTDPEAVADLPARVHDVAPPLDALVPLVGGWRGGGGITGQTEVDYRFLESAFTSLRLTSTAFWPDLVASDAGRVLIVSSTTVAAPTAGAAAYTALKAAAESWIRSLAHGFASATPARSGSETPTPASSQPETPEPRGAALAYRVRSLAGREADLAHAVVHFWHESAADLNGRIAPLPPIPENG